MRIINNTVLTGARRIDGYQGSIRMTNQYGAVPKRARPILANNVIAVLEDPNQVCSELLESTSNLILDGEGCSKTDHDRRRASSARTAAPTRLPRRSCSAAPTRRRSPRRVDITGQPRSPEPDIGAFQYTGAR